MAIRVLDENTLCPDCGTGMAFYKQFRTGQINYFCACRNTMWENKCPATPCPSCARLREKMKDREGLSKVILLAADDFADDLLTMDPTEIDQNTWPDRIADAVIRWLEEKEEG